MIFLWFLLIGVVLGLVFKNRPNKKAKPRLITKPLSDWERDQFKKGKRAAIDVPLDRKKFLDEKLAKKDVLQKTEGDLFGEVGEFKTQTFSDLKIDEGE